MFKLIIICVILTINLVANDVKNKTFFITSCDDTRTILDNIVRQLMSTVEVTKQIELIDTFNYVVENVSKPMCTYKDYMYLKNSASMLSSVKDTILSEK